MSPIPGAVRDTADGRHRSPWSAGPWRRSRSRARPDPTATWSSGLHKTRDHRDW